MLLETHENLTIGALALAAGVNLETIRFYQRKGLMTEPARPHRSVRRYGLKDLARLGFIKSAQRLGFHLDEIAELLKLDDGADCHSAKEQAKAKLAQVRMRLEDMQRIERALVGVIVLCEQGGMVRCPLIESLSTHQA
jgi:MerR family transcriptional regulator, mercuric resistance operon regulatory protein